MANVVLKKAADQVASLPWGAHSCHLYKTKKDLLDILVPYFKAGLSNDEFCLWITSKPAEVKEFKRAMGKVLPKFASYLKTGQIEILPYTQWYLKDGVFNSRRVLTGWGDKCNQALARGYEGMRLTGDTFWLKKTTWRHFAEYEEELDRTVSKLRIKAICTYCLDKWRAAEVIDVVKNHGFTVIKRREWALIENAQRRHAEERAHERGTAQSEKLAQTRPGELENANRKLLLEITERKRAAEVVRQAQERTEAVLASVADVHILFDRHWRYHYVNEAALRAIGRPREQILGRTLWELYPDIVGTELERQYHRAMEERLPVAFDFYYSTRDTWWANRFYPAPDGLAVFATNITPRKRAEEELARSREQLRALARYLQTVREKERTRIARELHDEIGQALTAIKFSLETSVRETAGRAAPGLVQALGLTHELIGRVRDLSLELRPAMLDDLGLLAALRWHFDPYTTQFKIKVDFKHAGLEGRRFEREIETAAYRIVQEALTNVARHAGVDNVEVKIQADEGALRIRIKDHGNGFDPESVTASITGGLSGMRERAIMLRGQLRIESRPGDGTDLVAELPLTSRQQT